MTTHELAKKLLDGPDANVGIVFVDLRTLSFGDVNGWVHDIDCLAVASVTEATDTDSVEPDETVVVLCANELTITAEEMKVQR